MTSTDLITLEQVEDVLLHGGVLEVVDSEALQADMVKRILASESLEEAFRGFASTPAKQLDGVPIVVHGVAWLQSAYAEGPPVYALLDITREGSDDHEVVSMGGRTLMASFLWAQRQEAMPMGGMLRFKPSNANPERGVWTFDLA